MPSIDDAVDSLCSIPDAHKDELKEFIKQLPQSFDTRFYARFNPDGGLLQGDILGLPVALPALAAAQQKAAARERYLRAPQMCQECGQPIMPKPHQAIHDVRHQRFCGRSCAAIHNNKQRVVTLIKCARCGDLIPKYRDGKNARKHCDSCWAEIQAAVAQRTKTPDNRREIANHAATALNGRSRICEKCGYDKHVERCHLRPVSGFPDGTPFAVINDPINLIYLCPNCHWELDHPEH